jgi:hypothetical protein
MSTRTIVSIANTVSQAGHTAEARRINHAHIGLVAGV